MYVCLLLAENLVLSHSGRGLCTVNIGRVALGQISDTIAWNHLLLPPVNCRLFYARICPTSPPMGQIRSHLPGIARLVCMPTIIY